MSFVKKLTIDKRGEIPEQLVSSPCDNAEAALSAVRQLDGQARTEVVLEGPGKKLFISGGNDGRYIAFASVDNDRTLFNLLNGRDSPLEEELEVVTGGQAGLFPPRQCVDLPTALKAAAYFFESGESSPELIWERQ
jgi:hypothetical protein